MRSALGIVTVMAAFAWMAMTPDEAAAQRFPRAARLLDRLRPPVRSLPLPPPIAVYPDGPTSFELEVYPGGLVYYRFVPEQQREFQSQPPPREPDNVAPTSEEELPAPGPQPGARASPKTDLLTTAKHEFFSASYEAALRALHELLANEPRNGQAMLLTSHALFGLEEFPQATETLRSALGFVPQTEWGEGVRNYRTYFASPVEYADRLRALEAYTPKHPDQASGHVLLGYHYGYLGLRSDALRHFEQVLAIDPNDALAATLAEQFRQRPASIPAQSPPPEPKAAVPTEESQPAERVQGPLLVRPVE